MKKVYVTITGMKYYYGFNPFSIGKKLTCKKEHNNPYDSEAIKVTIKTSARSAISQIRRTPKPTAQWAPAQSISMSRKNSKSE